MLLPSKKTHVSCLTLLGDLAEASLEIEGRGSVPGELTRMGVGTQLQVTVQVWINSSWLPSAGLMTVELESVRFPVRRAGSV